MWPPLCLRRSSVRGSHSPSAGKLGTSRIQTLGQDPQVTAFTCLCLTGPSWAESSQGPAHTLSSRGHADGRNGKRSTGASLCSCCTSMPTAPAPHSQGSLTHLSPVSPSMPSQAREALKLYCILIASHVTPSQIHGWCSKYCGLTEFTFYSLALCLSLPYPEHPSSESPSALVGKEIKLRTLPYFWNLRGTHSQTGHEDPRGGPSEAEPQ